MVSFRLSEEEYANLRSLCETGGARSVSDLARDAVSRLIRPDSHVEVAAALRVLEGRVDTLDLKVHRLTTAGEQDTSRTARQSPER
jgi:Arc/MetJ-type ribon-helix-helix transcriptional regulator